MDLRSSIRSLYRNPGFAALVIATMALGIGANTAMFGVIRAVLLRPLPFPGQERLVTLWETDVERGVRQRRLTPANFVDIEAQSGIFEAMGALPNWEGKAWIFNIVSKDGMNLVPGIYASSGFFRTLGVAPLLGETFGPEDDRQHGRRRVVISHRFWREQFAGDRGVIGKTLEVDTFAGGAFTVAGVMPESFDFPNGSRIWLSLADWGGGPMPTADAPTRCCAWYAVIARLKPGISLERAESELTAIARRISSRYPASERVMHIEVMPLRRTLVGSHELAISGLFGAVGCVLLIGCANVANLLLSRGAGRRKEMTTRMALGASRLRIARLLLTESLVLAVAGAAAGLLLAVWAQSWAAAALTGRIPMIEQTRMDWTVLGFAALATVFSGLACGIAPLTQFRAADWTSRGQTENRTSRRLRQALVVGEVAIAVMLAACAGLLLRTVEKLQGVDLGFDLERTLTVSTDLTTEPLRGRGNASRFLEELMPRLASLPGVRTVGAVTGMPLDGGRPEQPITREGDPPQAATESPRVRQTAVTPGYFTLMGTPLREGRGFSESDVAEGKLVAVINETAARRYWREESPVGRRFAVGSRERFGSFRQPGPGGIEWREIVGVVADMRTAGYASEVQPEVFYNYKQFPIYDPIVLLRTAGDPMGLAAAVRHEMAAVNSRVVITAVNTLEGVASESIAEQRLRAVLVSLFSTLALGLGMLGIYGVMSYTVARRTQEIGIRMALGAQEQQVSRMIVREALVWTGIGLALGLAGAYAVGRWMTTLLFGVHPGDPVTLAATCLVVAAVALAASYGPARRAMRVDPVVALRTE